MTDWHRRFLALAEHLAGWSKDPSTKVGCVIVDPLRRVVSVGYNGFPRGVIDDEERLGDRDTKYEMIVHSEPNAIVAAGGRDMTRCTIYTWPFPPCSRCAGLIIQAGIERVVAPRPSPEQEQRWGRSLKLAAAMFREAAVELVLL